MKVQVNDAEHSQKELVVEIPYEVFKEAADKELDALLPKAKIHGFRTGKAPREVVRKQFSHQIRSQAIEKVINEAVQDAMSSNNIAPISQAHISDVVFEDDKPITFTARVDVFPTLNLSKYKDFPFKKIDVEITDKDIDEALRISQSKEFVDTKPLGVDEPISQGGTNVSGGQKQRLSIARAIIKKPEIYIFDDSFSALDFKTDAALREELMKSCKKTGSTVLLVAQRISSILHADQIIVLDEGRMVGKGTHQELIKSCRIYQEIASSQLSKEELANV